MKKQFVKVLSLVMALMMVVGTFATVSFAADEHVHTKGTKGATVAPTCYGLGYTWYTCAGCGEQYMDDIVDKLEHKIERKTEAASCTKAAFTYDRCVNAGCDYGKKKDVKVEYVEGSEALGHTFTVVYTKPTCEKDAKSEYKCTRCNKTASALGMATGEYATITHTGTKLVHEYTYTLVSAAKGCTDGSMTGVCKKCNQNITVKIAAPHAYVEDDDTVKDCNNIKVGIVCENCDKVATQGTVVYLKDGTQKTAPAVVYESSSFKPQHTYDSSKISMVEVQLMGYDTFYQAATCVSDGYSINYCTACNKHIVTVLEAKGEHTWVQKEVVKAVVNTAATGTVCHTAVIAKYECASCGAKKETVVRDATAHTLYTVETKADCVSEGLITTYCKYCTEFTGSGEYSSGYRTIKYTAAKLGHDLVKSGKVYGYSGTTKVTTALSCATGKYQLYVCDRDDCPVSGFSYEEEIVPKNGTCDTTNNWKNYDATCLEPSYRLPMCKVCGAVDTTAAKSYTGTTTNANNHIIPTDTSKIVINKYPTCTDKGLNYYTCANPDCGVQGLSYETNATGHREVQTLTSTGTAYTTAPKYNNKTLTAADIKAATCNAEGLKMGKWCTSCGKWTVMPTVLAKDPDAHVAAGVSIGVVSELTCSTDKIVKYSYACCSTVYEVVEAKATGSCSSTSPWLDTKDADFKDYSCTNGGTHAYTFCPGCNWVYEVNTAGCTKCTAAQHAQIAETLNPAAPAKGHTWVNVKAKNETCTDAGHTAYKYCSECNVTQGYKVIPAHADQYKIGSSGKAETDSTCLKTGVSYDGDTVYDSSAKASAGKCEKCDKKTIPVKSHNWQVRTDMNSVVGNSFDCTSASFTVYYCNRGCGEYRVNDNVYQNGEAAHDWNDAWNEYSVKDGLIYLNGKKLSDYTIDYVKGEVRLGSVVVDTFADDETFDYCGFVARKFKTCANAGCTEELTENVQAPASHYYIVDGAMTNIDIGCKKISAFYGVTCAGCNKEVVATAAAGKLSAVHDFKHAQKDPTCTTDGYDIWACTDCGKYDKTADGSDYNIVLPKLGHDGEKDGDLLLERVDPVGSKDGYRKYQCLTCGAEYTIVYEAADLTFSFVTDNKLVKGASAVNSGIVSLIVNTNAIKLDVNTIKLDLGYDPTVLSFVNAEVLNSAFTNRAYAGAETYTDAKGVKHETGSVSVAISAPNTADGKIQNVTLNGDNAGLVKLNFKVLETAINEGEAFADIAGKKVAYFETSFWCNSYEVAAKDGLITDTKDDNYISVAVVGELVKDFFDSVVVAADTEYNYGALALISKATLTDDDDAFVVATAKIYALGDVNMDGIMAGANKVATVDDAIALVKIWTNESALGKYSAAADIDKDGAITVADYELLMMYITNEISYAAFLNGGVEPKTEDSNVKVEIGANGEIIIKPAV